MNALPFIIGTGIAAYYLSQTKTKAVYVVQGRDAGRSESPWLIAGVRPSESSADKLSDLLLRLAASVSKNIETRVVKGTPDTTVFVLYGKSPETEGVPLAIAWARKNADAQAMLDEINSRGEADDDAQFFVAKRRIPKGLL